MYSHTRIYSCWFMIVCCMLFSFLLSGCSSESPGQTDNSSSGASEKKGAPRDNTPDVLIPEASGKTVYSSDIVSIDVSNTSEGYVMVQYTGNNEKVKFQMKTPDGTEYTYLVTDYGEYEAYPLPGENGSYTLILYESVSVEDNLYAVSFTQDIDVTINNEFSPFLYPNHYVNFNSDSEAVKRGEALAKDCYSDLDVITNIYNYVIKNVSYDEEKAKNVDYGYSPNVDETLSTKKGICFDYAALMTAMLRTQRIPTKLEVGYAGEVYHAWISCYVDERGWVDNIIEFDGKNWSLMDPTFAANNDSSSVKEYIGDGSKYIVKYTY